MFNIKPLIRPNIASLKPYISEKSEYGENCVLLDANENPFGNGTENRYPDPYQSQLRKAVAERNNLNENQILFGNGSDELIDMLMRVFCEPQKDSILVCPPTFGMYEVIATVNDVTTKKISLRKNYQVDTQSIIESQAKILFLPCPNSPTGNVFNAQDLESIVCQFNGLVVLDEAYIDFAERESWVNRLKDFPNLVVLQTFSKYWALAGCRIGMIFASPEIIEVMRKIKMPYNLNTLSAEKAFTALKNESIIRRNADLLVAEREWLRKELSTVCFVRRVFPSQSNFLWINIPQAKKIKKFLKESGIIVRGYSEYTDFLRISVGLPTENKTLINALKNYKS